MEEQPLDEQLVEVDACGGRALRLSARDLAIIVVTHESEESLERLLSLLGPDLLRLALVIDNGSRDGTVSVARKAGARTIVNADNLGYAAACNQGATALDARVLCFLNPDCEPTPALFQLGCGVVEADAAACAAPILIEHGGREVSGRQPGYSRLKIAFDILETNCGGPIWRWMTRLRPFHDRTWAWPHGACWFVARQAFLDLGGMNPRFFLYMEDVDFGRRWSRKGCRTVLLEYRLPHRQGESSRVPSGRRRALLNRARIEYAAMYHGHWLAWLLECATLPDRVVRNVFRQSS